MGRLIDAERLKAHYCWWSGGTKEMTIDEAKKTFDTIIDVQPTVDAERHGHWIHDYDLGCTTCSKCGDYYLWEDFNGPGDWNYCPNCGARMDGERREDGQID